MKTLLCWVGFTDIRAAKSEEEGLGPIGQVVKEGGFDDALFLMDANTAKDRGVVETFLNELAEGETKFEFRSTDLKNPIDFQAIYRIANAALSDLTDREPVPEVTIHLSPGTPAMQAVWILLAARSAQTLVQSSREHGVQRVKLPFDIHAEFLPDMYRAQGRRITDASTEPHLSAPGFEDIRFRSPQMAAVVERAMRVAALDVPVLIEGESGTGKEMFANAIHHASGRADQPLIVVNCGAVPENLIESMLFGHVKGAFTDADADKAGYFEDAGGGTIFLDEIGELPLGAQTRLLRVLQERKIQRVGSSAEISVDVRIVSATNRDLRMEVGERRFREDLYYRLAVTKLTLPPVRMRKGDLQLLTDELFEAGQASLGIEDKKLSPSARKVIAAHSWPGNVRELQSTLLRSLIFSEGQSITADDMRDAVERVPTTQGGDLLARPLGDGFDLDELLADIKEQYVRRALEEAKDNKSRAAELLGYKQQTLWAYTKKIGLR